MKKKTITVLLSILFIAVLLAMNIPAGSIDDPEIVDEEDNVFDYIDALSAWFHEDANEPEYLFVTMKLVDLSDHIGTVYAIHWEYNKIHYDVGLHNGRIFPRLTEKRWSCHYYKQHPIFFWRETLVDTWNESTNNGIFDINENTVTWKIHKQCVGNPQPGETLNRPYLFTAQRISKLGLIPVFFIPFSYELSDASSSTEGQQYIIQY